MSDGKVTIWEIIKPRRRTEVRDLAIAAYYPRTQSMAPLRPIIRLDVQKRRSDNATPEENVAKPWKKPWDK